jgi:transcriptional regulator with XRE-family HTH domain
MDSLEAQALTERARRGLSLAKMAQQTGVSFETLRYIAQMGRARHPQIRWRLQSWLEGHDPIEAEARSRGAEIEARLAALPARLRAATGDRTEGR